MKTKVTYVEKKKKRSKSSRLPFILALIILILLLLMCLLSFQLVNFVPVIPDVTPIQIQPTETPTPCNVELAFIEVAHNREWTPCERDFDGIPMMLVPVGCITFNADNAQSIRCFDNPYWIDKYEVTNEAFGALKCSSWSTAPHQPHICVTWDEAKAFCEQRQARLPTEEEWEYTAKGVDGWQYPWGDSWDKFNVHWNLQTSAHTETVYSRPQGISWIGAYHMSGNVWEWVTSSQVPYRIAKGGSYNSSTIDLLTTTYRLRHFYDYSDNGTGLRCLRDFDAIRDK